MGAEVESHIAVASFVHQSCAAVLPVTDDWKSSMRGLESQLMHATTTWCQFQKTAIQGCVVDPQARLRFCDLGSAGCWWDDFSMRLVGYFSDMIDPASQLLRLNFSVYPSVIDFGHFSAGKLVTK